MDVRSSLFFDPYHDILPRELCKPEAATHIPTFELDNDLIAPLGVYDQTLLKLSPVIRPLGDGAVKWSLEDREFKIMQGVENTISDQVSQAIAGIGFWPNRTEEGPWRAELTTAEPLSELDARLFLSFIRRYLLLAGTRIVVARPTKPADKPAK